MTSWSVRQNASLRGLPRLGLQEVVRICEQEKWALRICCLALNAPKGVFQGRERPFGLGQNLQYHGWGLVGAARQESSSQLGRFKGMFFKPNGWSVSLRKAFLPWQELAKSSVVGIYGFSGSFWNNNDVIHKLIFLGKKSPVDVACGRVSCVKSAGSSGLQLAPVLTLFSYNSEMQCSEISMGRWESLSQWTVQRKRGRQQNGKD